MSETIDKIDRCLPQTQCTRCGYPSCHDYAEAIAQGEAEINQCPPGGEVTIKQLAKLLDKPQLPLNEIDHGKATPRQIVKIDEDECIGCTVCIKACPVDAIIGSHKLMHAIITDQCTGCELCIPPCPMDCIHIEAYTDPITENEPMSPWPGYSQSLVDQSRQRYNNKTQRAARPKENQLKARKLGTNARKSMIADILKAQK